MASPANGREGPNPECLGRSLMWTLHTGETLYNPQIADDEAQRCLPMSGAS